MEPSFLKQALTHRSFVNEHLGSDLTNNERLEFLGDAVLNLTLSDLLLKKYPDLPEGSLSKIRAGLVNERKLADLALQLGLGVFLLIGKGEEMTGGREKPSILANTLEALLGAIYLDGGFNAASIFVDRLFRSELRDDNDLSSRDYKTLLQEYCQGKIKKVPVYRLFKEEGPDHKKIFFVEVTIQDQVISKGQGRTKKEAQQRAAEKALLQLKLKAQD
ncbi:MAG: ribonuclease III [Desulfobacca sp.]|nr:ribonuclease III [Desulfobacca sp.]